MEPLNGNDLMRIIPKATAWIEEQENLVLKKGVRLNEAQFNDAKYIGVDYPQRVKLLKVIEIPKPQDNELLKLAESTGLFSKSTDGMAFRYGIMLKAAYWNDRHLLIHELIHTRQYEQLGGFKEFLVPYLSECIYPGYPFGPLEQEAINESQRIVSMLR